MSYLIMLNIVDICIESFSNVQKYLAYINVCYGYVIEG